MTMMRENETKGNSSVWPAAASEQDSVPRDFWPAEREGYSDTPRAAYATVAPSTPPEPARQRMSIRTESRIGALIMVVGLIWFAYSTLTQPGFLMLASMLLPPNGPVAVTGIGVLIWLHAKWRRSVTVV
jgi:hypothetical protein